MRKRKQPRAWDGKVRKHHWFKSGLTNMLLAKYFRSRDDEKKAVETAHKETMYESVRELFKARPR